MKDEDWFMKKKELGFGIAAAYCLAAAGVYAYKKYSKNRKRRFYIELGSGVKIKRGTIIPIKNKFTWNAETDEVISTEEV